MSSRCQHRIWTLDALCLRWPHLSWYHILPIHSLLSLLSVLFLTADIIVLVPFFHVVCSSDPIYMPPHTSVNPRGGQFDCSLSIHSSICPATPEIPWVHRLIGSHHLRISLAFSSIFYQVVLLSSGLQSIPICHSRRCLPRALLWYPEGPCELPWIPSQTCWQMSGMFILGITAKIATPM